MENAVCILLSHSRVPFAEVHKSLCKGVQAAKQSGGVHKEIIKAGTGPSPKKGAKISCTYVGKVRDASSNDNNVEFSLSLWFHPLFRLYA